MICEETVQKIVDKKEDLNSQLIYTKPEKTFINEFISNNNLQDLEGIVRVELCDFLIASILSKNFSLSVEEISQGILANSSIFLDSTIHDMGRIIENIEVIVANFDYKDLREFLERGKYQSSIKQFMEISNVARSHLFYLEVFFKSKNYKNVDMMELLELCRRCPNELLYSIKAASDIKRMRDVNIINIIYNRLTKKTSGTNLYLDKVADKFFLKYREVFYTGRLEKAIRFINNYNENIKYYEDKEKDFLACELKNYHLLEDWIRNCKDNREITYVNGIINKISDSSIRRAVLEDIYRGNIIHQQEVEQEYYQLSGDIPSWCVELFNKYGISLTKEDLSKFKKVDKLRELLGQLVIFDITDSTILVEILSKTDYERVVSVREYLESGYLDEKGIAKYMGLFDINSDIYLNFVNNVSYLDRFLSKEQMRNARVLQSDFSLVKENIAAIDNYNLLSSLKNTSSLDFLDTSDLEERIDQGLELGFEDFFDVSLDLLNEEEKKLKRIVILRRLGYEIDSYEDILEVLAKKNFVVLDDEIDQYIFDKTKYIDGEDILEYRDKQDYLDCLEPYSKTKLTYNIDGVIIAKNKVKRNLDLIQEPSILEKDFLKCLLKGSIVDQDEYDKVVGVVKKDTKEYKKEYI